MEARGQEAHLYTQLAVGLDSQPRQLVPGPMALATSRLNGLRTEAGREAGSQACQATLHGRASCFTYGWIRGCPGAAESTDSHRASPGLHTLPDLRISHFVALNP